MTVLSTSKGIKRLGVFKTKYAWRFAEPPVDYRARDALIDWDQDLAEEVLKYHRKHGGKEGIANSLNGYDRYYSNFNSFDEDTQYNWLKAKDAVRDMLQMPFKVAPRSEKRYRPRPSNSGYPHYTNRRDIIEDIHADTHAFVNFLRFNPEVQFRDVKSPPVTPMLKSMPSLIEKGPKTRGIWCYPAVMTNVEDMFFSELYSLILKHRDLQGLPLMHGIGAFTRARDVVCSIDVGQGGRTLDWVKGDSQMPPWLIKMAKEILEGMMDFTRFESYHVSHKWSEANKRVWDYTWWYFINTPLVFDDVLYRKTGGIPSGSLMTLLVWSVVGLITNVYLGLRVEKKLLTKKDLAVCGDDSVARVTTAGLTIDDFITAARECQIEFHGSPKSKLLYWPASTRLQTLSTTFGSASMWRDEIDLFARIIYPGRWISCREESVARALMLDLSVLKTMPRVHAFVVHYATFKAAWLKKPIFIDRDLDKYFRYVTNAPSFRFRPGATLGTVFRAYKKDLKIALMLSGI